MDIETTTVDGVTVVMISGDLDASTAPAAQQQLLAMSKPGCRILLDMSGVPYMSSAGLRMLLSAYRQLSSNDGRIVLVGVVDEIQDTMAVTGFLNFFTLRETRAEGLSALRA